jgi:hypothetical protein
VVVNACGASCDGRFGAGASLLTLGPSLFWWWRLCRSITVAIRKSGGGHSFFEVRIVGVRKYS